MYSTTKPRWYAVTLLLLSLTTLLVLRGFNEPVSPEEPPVASAVLTSLPMVFEEYQKSGAGSTFTARGKGYTAGMSDSGIHLYYGIDEQLSGVVSLRLEGASPNLRPMGEDLLESTSSYFIGADPEKWKHGVRHFSGVRYSEVYPGIDLLFYGSAGNMEFDFEVAPGANPSQISFGFDGAESAKLQRSGDIIVAARATEFGVRSPNIFQENDGGRSRIEGKFVRKSNGRFGVNIGEYDASKRLVIDPVVVLAGTYLGGPSGDGAKAVAVDRDGEIYVLGSTTSTGWIPDNPAMPFAGSSSLYIMRLTPDAKTLLWSGFIGGSNGQSASDIAVDLLGYIYISGDIKREEGDAVDFPRTRNIGSLGLRYGFVVKINPAANALVYSNLVGGGYYNAHGDHQGHTSVNALAVDTDGNAYAAGQTDSWDFPTTDGAYTVSACMEDVANGFDCYSDDYRETDWDQDGWAGKFSAMGVPEYITLIGTLKQRTTLRTTEENFDDGVSDILVDDQGRAYVTGFTSGGCDDGLGVRAFFPTTAGAIANCDSDRREQAFITVLTADGSNIVRSALFGAEGNDTGIDMAFGPDNKLWLAGKTNSVFLPASNGAYMETLYDISDQCIRYHREDGDHVYQPCIDAFLARFPRDVSSVEFLTYVGGHTAATPTSSTASAGEEFVTALVTDSQGNVYVAGRTPSELFRMVDAYQPMLKGSDDGFLAAFTKDGAVKYVTYVGGTGPDYINGMALTESESPLIVGTTISPDWATGGGTDPALTVTNSYQTGFGGGTADGFLLILGESMSMKPEGVVYDQWNYDLDKGALQSTFTDLKIIGGGLQDVTDVVFKIQDGAEWKEDLNLIVSDVAATATEITYKLEVVHGAELGKRRVFLEKPGSPDINVSAATGKEFLVSMGSVTFNQAVDDRSMKTDAYHRVQVAEKPGVYRFQFDDPKRDNESYLATLHIRESNAFSNPAKTYLAKTSYSEREILDGANFLTIKVPMPDGAAPGTRTFYADLYSTAWHLRTPDIKREFVLSDLYGILVRRFTLGLPSGHFVAPNYTDAQAEQAFDFLRKVFPVTPEMLDVTYLGTRALPADIDAQYDPATAAISEAGQQLLLRKMGRSLKNWNRDKGRDLRDHVFVGLVSRGLLGARVAGLANEAYCSVLIADDLPNLGATIAHEVGHMIEMCRFGYSLRSAASDNPVYDLGDEYKGGIFNCQVNPPGNTVQGLAPIQPPGRPPNDPLMMTCADSRLVNGVHADDWGSYVLTSGYDPVADKPRIHWKSTSGGPSAEMYNYMGSAAGDDKNWVSPLVYDALHRIFLRDLPTAPKQNQGVTFTIQPALEVTGVVRADGSTLIQNIDKVDVVPESPSAAESEFQIELTDAAGFMLSSLPAHVSFIQKSNPPKLLSEALFKVVIPTNAGASAVRIVKNGLVMAESSLTSGTPEIAITSPPAGSTLAGIVDLTWRASDSDGDALTYSVLVSKDGGENFIPFDELLTATTYRLDTSELGSPDNISIKVLANDGYNTGQATIGATLRSDPTVSSVSPSRVVLGIMNQQVTVTGARFQDGAIVSISGGGVTVDSTVFVSSNALDVILDVSTSTLTGARDVKVQNPDGKSAVGSGLLEITEGQQMNVDLSWSPPDEAVASGPPQNLSGSATVARPSAKRQNLIQLRLPHQMQSNWPRSHVQFEAVADTVDEVEPNNAIDEAQLLNPPFPVVVEGDLDPESVSEILITYTNGGEDLVEDMYKVTTTEPGLYVALSDFDFDCQLYVIDLDADPLEMAGFSVVLDDTMTEVVDLPELVPGNYLIGASIIDYREESLTYSTPYHLLVNSGSGSVDPPDPTDKPTAYRVYRSASPSAKETGLRITEIPLGEVLADPETWTDPAIPAADYYYAVTAVYGDTESTASNEVLIEGPTQDVGNRAPVLTKPFEDVQLLVGTESYRLNMFVFFSDPDEDVLSYTASSSNTAVVQTSVSAHVVQIEPLSTGEASVTISASDGLGGVARAIFRVAVPTGVDSEGGIGSFRFDLKANYPNPFASRTTIAFETAEPSHVVMEIYNVVGRKVAVLTEGRRPAGRYQVHWDGRSITGQRAPYGTYFVRMQAGKFEAVRKLVLLP